MEGEHQHLDLFAKVKRGKLQINLRGAKVALDRLAKTFDLKLKIKYRRNFLQLFKRGKKDE